MIPIARAAVGGRSDMSVQVMPGGHCCVCHVDYEDCCPTFNLHVEEPTPCTEACGKWYIEKKTLSQGQEVVSDGCL